MPFPILTAERACEALRGIGIRHDPAEVRVEPREARWVVHLPGARLAWFAASDEGRRRLATERRVLRLLQARCTFGAPRVLLEDPTGDFDVRAMVAGVCDPWGVFARVRDRADLAIAVGRAVGGILAEQHTRIDAADVAGWLPRAVAWPASRAWIREQLPRVVDLPRLRADADRVMAAYEAVPVSDADRVLVHTDVGFHNLGVDPTSLAVYGIFDYDGAAWADRHHDFRYLVFDADRYELLDAARAVYEPAVGATIHRSRVLLYNAACAITFLAQRVGSRPEERPCGRTLAEDVSWCEWAIARAGCPPSR